jgi:hypothetical protein
MHGQKEQGSMHGQEEQSAHMLTSKIRTSVKGLSVESVSISSTWLRVSRPPTTLPKTCKTEAKAW